jgi:hypothetical protein
MVRYFVTLAALAISLKWMTESSQVLIRNCYFLPFFLGSIASFLFYLMEKRVTIIIRALGTRAADIEEKIYPGGGFFASDKGKPVKHVITFPKILNILYLGTSFLLLILFLVSLWFLFFTNSPNA